MAVKPIIHDELSLKFKSIPATKQDLAEYDRCTKANYYLICWSTSNCDT